MGLFKRDISASVTYDGQGAERPTAFDNVFYNLDENILLARHPYDDLSCNAKVTVQEGQEMVFCSEGMFSDVFTPGPHVIGTNNVPFLQRITTHLFGGKTAFKTTLFVVSTTVKRLAGDDGGWGIGAQVRDYTFGNRGIVIDIGASGDYEFRIVDSVKFIHKYSGTQHEVELHDFASKFGAAISQRVTPIIVSFFDKEHLSITSVNGIAPDGKSYFEKIQEYALEKLNAYFIDDYGVEITKFDIEAILPDDDDPNYKRILDSLAKAADMDIESQALADKRAREGYNYQQERQFDVMQTAAGNTGGAGAMMGAGMGMGMGFGMGGMFGQQMGMMAQNVAQAQPIQQGAAVPPPPPAPVAFHVLINNAQQGPYDLATLQQMAQQGTLTLQTFVWKAGMAQWAAASQCPELQGLFAPVPPPPPVM